MSQYNKHNLPFLGKYQICAPYQLKTIIFASKWIHFTQFIDRIENMTSYTTLAILDQFIFIEWKEIVQ